MQLSRKPLVAAQAVAGLAQIIDARPQVVPDDIRGVPHRIPGRSIAAGGHVRVLFGAANHGVRIALMNGAEEEVLVVHAHDVFHLGQPGQTGRVAPARYAGMRVGTGVVELFGERNQVFEGLGNVGGHGAGGNDLVAQAPDHDAGMVPVAFDERGEVLLPDLVEIGVERTGVGPRPLVAPFIHDHHAQLVAIIIEFRALLIVRRADGRAA